MKLKKRERVHCYCQYLWTTPRSRGAGRVWKGRDASALRSSLCTVARHVKSASSRVGTTGGVCMQVCRNRVGGWSGAIMACPGACGTGQDRGPPLWCRHVISCSFMLPLAAPHSARGWTTCALPHPDITLRTCLDVPANMVAAFIGDLNVTMLLHVIRVVLICTTCWLRTPLFVLVVVSLSYLLHCYSCGCDIGRVRLYYC